MMNLFTYPFKTSDPKTFIVLWSKGLKERGILTMKVEFDCNDPTLIAELAAIRHLLFERKVFNCEVLDGVGIKLYVGRGAIKKLSRASSSKSEVFGYAAFVRTRLAGVTIEVCRKPSEFLPELTDDVSKEDVTVSFDEYYRPHEPYETPAMGTLYITYHALEAYIDKISTGDPRRPFKSLVKRLNNPKLEQVPLPERVLKHKARKYGPDKTVEAWSMPHGDFTYLCALENGKRTLVTVFENKSTVKY